MPYNQPTQYATRRLHGAREYLKAIAHQRELREALRRAHWTRRMLAFASGPKARQHILHNGLDEAGKRLARADFRRLRHVPGSGEITIRQNIPQR